MVDLLENVVTSDATGAKAESRYGPEKVKAAPPERSSDCNEVAEHADEPRRHAAENSRRPGGEAM